MPYALFQDGVKIKEAALLPTRDQSMPNMAPGFEWLEINDGPKPAHDSVTEELVVTEKKVGGKWKKTYAKQSRPDAQGRAEAAIDARLTALLRGSQDSTILAIVRAVRGVETEADIALLNRIISNASNAESLKDKVARGEAHDIATGWSE